MPKELHTRRAPLSRGRRYISLDERFWERLEHVAQQHYGGNRSRALEGLLLHDWLVEANKRERGQNHSHWISAPLVMNLGELEPLLDRLQRGEADAVGSYVDRLVEERVRHLQPPVSSS